MTAVQLARNVEKLGVMSEVQSPKVPERMCLVCRVLKPRNRLLRLVKSKEDGNFIPNAEGSRSGKGIYFCRVGDCLQRMQKERRLRRQFLEKLPEETWQWMLAQHEGDSGRVER